MAQTYFTQYIDNINLIMQEARAKHNKAADAFTEAEKSNKEAQSNPKFSPAWKMVEAEKFHAAKQEYNEAVKKINEEAALSISAVRHTLTRHIAKYVAADPEKVDQSAVMLLNSGAMSDGDLVALANKFWNNPTMLKLISSHAEKNLDNSRSARLLASSISKYLAPESRLGVFDSAARIASRALSADPGRAATFQKHWDDHFYGELKDEMSALDSFSVEEV